jgi:uncharacterized membrane protein YccF (DUF307 family)
MGLMFTLFIGIRLCIMLVAAGLLLCLTIIGIPPGVTLMALGFKYLALPQRRFL